MRNIEEKKRDTMILNVIKAICIFIMTMFCFFNDFLLDHIGGIICIFAISFMVIPRKLINWSLDNLEE